MPRSQVWDKQLGQWVPFVTPGSEGGQHVLEGDKDNPPVDLADYQLLYDPNEPGPDYPVLASPWALVGATTMVIPKNSNAPDAISNWSSFLTNAPDWFELVDNQTLRVVQPGWYQVTICCPIQSAAATGPMTFASRIDVSVRGRIEGNPPSGSDSTAGVLPVTPYGSRTPGMHTARVRWTTPRLLYLTMADRDTANSGATWQAATPILVRVERVGEP